MYVGASSTRDLRNGIPRHENGALGVRQIGTEDRPEGTPHSVSRSPSESSSYAFSWPYKDADAFATSGLHTTLDLPDLPCGLDHRQRVGKSELQGHDPLFGR